MMYVVDAADPFRSIRQPLQVEKWATDNDLHDCPWTIRGLSHPGQIFSDSPHGEEPNVLVTLAADTLTDT